MAKHICVYVEGFRKVPLEAEEPCGGGIPIGHDRQARSQRCQFIGNLFPVRLDVPSSHTAAIRLTKPGFVAGSDDRPMCMTRLSATVGRPCFSTTTTSIPLESLARWNGGKTNFAVGPGLGSVCRS